MSNRYDILKFDTLITKLNKIQISQQSAQLILSLPCRSIKKLFKTYHSFSKISGVELNTTKIEILRIHDEHIEKEYRIGDADGTKLQANHLGTPVFAHYNTAR